MRAIRCGLGLLVAICFLGAATLSAQTTQTQTLPRGLRNVSGSSSLSVPFNATATQLWHFVYDSSHFQATGPIVITEVAFRADGLTWGPRTFPQVEVTLASSANDWRNGSYSTTLASNLIAPQVFYSGSQSLPAEASSSPPNPFRLTFSGSTGFRYDPTSGQDFVIVVRTPIAPSGTGSFVVDAQGAGGLATSYGHTSDPNAAVANASQVERAPVVLLSYRSTTGVQVNFDAGPRSGRANLAVSFLDRTWTSSPGISGWAWDFENDGVVDSTQQNPQHVYTAPGTYAVALAVTDPLFGAFRIVKPAFISIDSGVAVDFDATPRQGRAYLSVSFTDRSTTTGAGLSSWAWDFENDGVIDSTQRNPTHVYTRAGSYAVALEVSDPLHGSYRVVKPAFVQVDSGLSVDFDATPRQGRAYLSVSFTDRSTTTSSGLSSWAWDFENDGVIDSTQQNPTHVYTQAGTYDVALEVSDPLFGSQRLLRSGYVQVDPIEFDVYFTASPRVGDHRREVRFRDRTRISVEGMLQYEWDLDGDGIVDSQEPEPTFRYPGPGAYAVTLRVRHSVLGTRETSIPGFVRLGGTVHVDLAASGCGQANGSPALPFCTIHEALRVALDGDEVQIAPGVYPEILDLSRSVALVARSAGFVNVLRVRAVGPIVSRIEGLIVNSYQDGLDSGVIVANGSMEILGCRITDNGGFHPYNGPFLGSGAGINVSRGELCIERSLVSSNSTLGPSGGGIQCSYSRLTMVDCTVEGNWTSTDSIFACCGPRRGGGIALVSSRAELERARIRGNSAGGDNGEGGGISATGGSVVSIYGSELDQNFVGGGFARGGAIFSDSSEVEIISSLLSRNEARSYNSAVGGGLHVPAASVRNCTFVGNGAYLYNSYTGQRDRPDSNGALFASRGMLDGCILWGNEPPEIPASIVIAYSDVQGGALGVGNQNADPLFVAAANGDYRLRAGSPCIDAGASSFLSAKTDVRGLPRVLDGNLDRVMRPDLGAHEFSHVFLAVSGTQAPGGQLRFQNTGTNGLIFLRLLSTAPGTTWLPPFGTAFVDLASTWFEFHAGTIPNQLVIPIPPNVATPAELWFQDLALDPATLAGNLSNAVVVRLP